MKKWLFQKKWRIILSGMVIVALPIVLLSSFVYFVLIEHIRETVIETKKSTAIEAAHNIQDSVQDGIRAGKLIAARPLLHKAIKSADRKELTSRLKSFVANIVTIERAFIANTKGVLIADFPEDPSVLNKDFSYRDWFKGASKSRQPYVSEFYLRLAEPKRYIFAIAIPIKTERREVVGILVLQPEADYIKNAMSHMPVLKGQKVYLVDKKGNLIYHSDYAVDRIIDFSSIPVVPKVLRGEEGIETIDQDGVRMVSAYYPIKEFGWGVIVQRPEKEVFGHLRKISLALFVFAGVMLLVGAYFATKRSDLLFSLKRLSDELEERVEERTGELKRAKKEWEVTFDAISDPIFIHDKEFRVIRANRAYQEASEMPFEEMIGRLYFEVFPKMEGPFKMCLRAMEDIDDKEEVYVASLEKIFVVGFYPVRDKEGNYLYSAHIMEDITEEKRAMEALSESEEKFRTITASAKDAIIVIGNEGEVVSWNNAAEKISGYSAGKAMGKELHMFFAPERYRAAYREGFRRFRETGEGAAIGKTLELVALRKDGTEFPIELSISAVKLKGKWNAIGILRDITERKEAEEALHKSENRYRGLFEHMFEGFAYCKMLFENGEARDFIYLMVNNMFETLTGLKDVIGKRVTEVIPGIWDTDSELFEIYARVSLTGKPERFEIFVKALNMWFSISVYSPEKEFFVAVFDVITERKKMEAQLEKHTEHLGEMVRARTKELEDANVELQVINKELDLRKAEAEEARLQADVASRAKSDFLANMSHELRTPLNSIIGFSEILQRNMVGELNEVQKENLGYIFGSGMHLLSLINDILDLSKVEAGKLELELNRFKIKDILNASMIMLKEKAYKHNITMGLQIAPDADIEIEADMRKLKQIMFNLLSNAVKFTPDGGSVSVAARRVKSLELGVQSDINPPLPPLAKGGEGGFVEVSVTDTGIGIKPEDMEKIFTPFQQLESVYTKKYEGTGLGLALTKRLVELHGGSIWGESEFGEGSVFTFVIPIKQEIKEGREDAEENPDS